ISLRGALIGYTSLGHRPAPTAPGAASEFTGPRCWAPKHGAPDPATPWRTAVCPAASLGQGCDRSTIRRTSPGWTQSASLPGGAARPPDSVRAWSGRSLPPLLPGRQKPPLQCHFLWLGAGMTVQSIDEFRPEAGVVPEAGGACRGVPLGAFAGAVPPPGPAAPDPAERPQ